MCLFSVTRGILINEESERGVIVVPNLGGPRVRDKKRLEKVGNLVKNSYLYR